MTADPTRLDSLVASFADGWPQDWDAICALALDERTRRAASSLRTIAAIADSHRGATPPASASGSDERPARAPSKGPPPPDWKSPRPGAIPTLGEWGRFVLLKKLGEGAYGEVYQAHDTQLDREVALKLLKHRRSTADPGHRLLREARMLARVRHPNVASVYGAGEHDGRAGMWMELVRGVNLEELLRSRGPMSACEAALVGIDVCRALAAVHAAGVVHRDVKASNVMREVGGRIVLADFGAGSGPGLRHRRQLAGTPLYLAPEVLGGSEATVRSDLYSLGVVLFRMVTASYPRRTAHVADMLDPSAPCVTASLRDLRPDLPDAFVAAVELALAAQPADRPPSAGAFRSTLGLVLGVPNSWRRASRWPRTALSSAPTAALAPLDTTLELGGPEAPPSR
jgi:serine/threonine-protein kinase